MEQLVAQIQAMGHLSGSLSGVGSLNGVISKPPEIPAEEYGGPYEFTPTEDTQTIEIANKKAVTDIIINPIPTNYGRITWNGSVLTIS